MIKLKYIYYNNSLGDVFMLELLMNRRSIRKYKEQSIEKEKIQKLLQGALTSPSGKKIQPWELMVVDDREKLESLGKSRGGASRPLSLAPLAIVVLANPDATDVWIEDASIISVVIQLMAQSLDLGSCWIQVRERMSIDDRTVDEYVKEILDIPENYIVESMVAIGYPDEEKSPHKEEELPYDKVHYNKW